jgi:ADP-heptose:LPS heptosyltransferase
MSVFNKKILVIKLGALGDFIYALGAMKSIRLHHPDAHITLLTTKPYESLGRASGYCDEIILDPRPKLLEFKKILDWRAYLNSQQFNRVYDLQNNDRTSLYFKLFSPKPEWVGAVSGASHRNASKDRSRYHAFLGHRQTLSIGGVSSVDLDDLSWMVPSTEILLPKQSVLIVAGSAPSRPEKRWPSKQYHELCKLLIAKNFHPVLLGTDSERAVNSEIANGLTVTDLTGQTTIYDLPSLAKQSIGAIGNDTGPIHILSVTGINLLALFNSNESNIKKHAPQGTGSHSIETDNLKSLLPETVLNKFLGIIVDPKA